MQRWHRSQEPQYRPKLHKTYVVVPYAHVTMTSHSKKWMELTKIEDSIQRYVMTQMLINLVSQFELCQLITFKLRNSLKYLQQGAGGACYLNPDSDIAFNN